MPNSLEQHFSILYAYFLSALNSTFTTSLLVAFFGSLFGAYTAKRIAERTKLKDELHKEIRNINAASVMAHSITNAHFALKKQHVKAMYETFMAKRNELNDVQRRRAAGEQGLRFEVGFDLHTLDPLTQPIVPLQSLVFEKLNATAKSVMLMGILSQTSQALNDALANRNTIINTWKQQQLPERDMLILYLCRVTHAWWIRLIQPS